jgi:peptidoglycan hydrolase-like protein with peptidoglycan-binding domain
MRSHIQGVFILLIVGIALMGTARIAAPVVKEALGDEGAIVAESADVEDVVDLSISLTEPDAPLDSDEVGVLQLYLTDLGFDPGPVDGLMGANTRSALIGAITEYQLAENSSDRAVFAFVGSLVDALTAADVAESLDTEAVPGATGLIPSGGSLETDG